MTAKTVTTSATIREKIMDYPSCTEWLQTVRTDATREGFILHISKFCTFHNTTPDDIVKLPADQIKMLVIRYVNHLKKVAKQTAGKPKHGELSVNSIPQYMGGVKSFLDFNEIVLPWKKIRSFYPEFVSNDFRAYRLDEIRKILSFGDLRDNVCVLLMASAGLRVGALPTLKIKHLVELDPSQYRGIGMIKVYSESKRWRYASFVTPECMAAIKQYLESRERMFEKLTPESPLIRDKFALMSKKTNKPKAVKRRAITNQIVEMIKRAGLPLDVLQPDHSFRKFFNTAAKNSGIDHMYKEMLMGHSIKLDDVYYDTEDPSSVRKIAEEYVKAVNALTIYDENRLKAKVAELTVKNRDAESIINSRLAQVDAEAKSQIRQFVLTLLEQDPAKRQEQLLRMLNNGQMEIEAPTITQK